MDRRPSSIRHAVRIFAVIAVILIVAFVVRSQFVPDSFGELGHYRADALVDAKAFPVHHVGRATCAECHDDVAALHAKDAHATVQCETCHGPGAEHVAAGGDEPIARPDGRDACLVCHRLLLARPGEFAQVEVAAHYAFVGVGEPATECIACHDPHEPLYMDRDLRTARLHPLIQRCRDCHAGRTDRSLPRPADHPAIFECDYCHGGVAADFAERTHAHMRCTACHIFFRESEFAGRIVRDTDPRFCLLCHRAADFRGETAAPSIVWPGHLTDMMGDDADPATPCVDCHQDQIHELVGSASGGPDRKDRDDG